jgi:phosphoribosylformylglycinamidine cyclo-ligase
MMKEGLTAKLEKAALPSLPIFHLLQSVGNIPEHDMYNTFNMGIGMCLVVSADEADKAAALLRETGERVSVIGRVEQGTEGVVLC